MQKVHTSLIVALMVACVVSQGALAEEPTTSVAPNAQQTSWAIAIHGGAGGDPSRWSEAVKAQRREGIEIALKQGTDLLRAGGDALDVVEQVIRLLEDNPAFNAGKGAVLTAVGEAELDASIMDGRNKAAGAVASVRTVKNPISLARKVMTETRHVLLVSTGAEKFAAEQGLEIVPPKYFLLDEKERELSLYRNDAVSLLGTVGCVVLDGNGNLAAGTSTGGLSKKMSGRVGDTPILGAGNYADNQTCAISGTGVGEEFIRHAVGYDVAAQMKYQGKELRAAVDEIMKNRLAPNTGGVISVDRQGNIVMQHNTPGMTCGAADSKGRFEVALVVQ